jgi:hypothetical protein
VNQFPGILLGHYTSGSAKVNLIKALLMHGAEPDDLDLAYAIRYNDHRFSMALLDHLCGSSDQYTSSEAVPEAAC